MRDGALASIDALAPAAAQGADALAEKAQTPEFGFVRALAIEAYYSDFVAPGKDGPGAWEEIDFNSPLATRLSEGLVVARDRVKDAYDVVVVGSGAGGGVIAGELAQRGRDVLLVECGPHLRAPDFTRFEAKAAHDLFWPLRFAPLENGELVTFLAGRCVGGTTTINTKVAFRAHERDVAKWHPASGLTSDGTTPFSVSRPRAVLRPRRAGARRPRAGGLGEERPHGRAGLPRARRRARGGQRLHRPELHELRLVHPGLPVERRQVDDEHVHRGRAGARDPRAACRHDGRARADRRAARRRASRSSTATGERQTVRAGAVVVAAGALNTPQLLLRSGLANPSIGRHLGLHPVRLVYGLFDEPQDAHMVYPISAHCLKHQHDEEGGFVIEATTIQDPIAFATTVGDEDGPFWGPRLVEAVRRFRYWVGFLAMANDDNNSTVSIGEDGEERIDGRPPAGGARAHRRRACGSAGDVLEAAGATQVCWTGLVSTHVQGSCRMGDDPERSVVDRNGESHEVKRLFVGDGSLVPRTLSVNPSLTIMALATRLADHLDADASGYLGARPAARAA